MPSCTRVQVLFFLSFSLSLLSRSCTTSCTSRSPHLSLSFACKTVSNLLFHIPIEFRNTTYTVLLYFQLTHLYLYDVFCLYFRSRTLVQIMLIKINIIVNESESIVFEIEIYIVNAVNNFHRLLTLLVRIGNISFRIRHLWHLIHDLL